MMTIQSNVAISYKYKSFVCLDINSKANSILFLHHFIYKIVKNKNSWINKLNLLNR